MMLTPSSVSRELEIYQKGGAARTENILWEVGPVSIILSFNRLATMTFFRYFQQKITV